MDWPAQIPDFNITENMGCAGEEVSEKRLVVRLGDHGCWMSLLK